MAKGSGLAVLGLILAIGALGIGGYTIFTTQLGPHTHQTYYDARITTFTGLAEDTWYDIPDISITFQVGSGETVYFLFTCTASITITGGDNRMNFQLKIDGVSITDAHTTVGGAISTNQIYSVSFQYATSLLTAGSHVVLVQTMFECGGSIDHCSLFVQTYIP